MIANRNFEQCEPLTWVGRVPVYLATAIAAVHGVALILSAFLLAAGAQGIIGTLAFSTERAIDDLNLWQFVTYAFVYASPRNYIWVAIQLVMLAMFGKEVEKFIGRKSFVWLYAILLMTPPLFLSVMHAFGMPSVLAGSASLQFGIFMAFVYIYPRAEIFFGIQARWIAAVLLGVYTLQLLADHAPIELGVLWLSCGAAVIWCMKEGVGTVQLPSLKETLKRRHSERQLRVVREEARQEAEVHESIDPILEKIARQGIGSLTRQERDKLERARAALLEKERRS